MRDILVLAIVFGASLYAFKHTWAGALAWTWLGLMNPHKQSWGIAVNFPVAAVVGGATLVSWIFSREKRMDIWTPASVSTLLLIIWLVVSTPFAFYPELAQPQLVDTLKVFVMIFVGMTVINDKRQLQYLVWVIVASLGYYGVKGGVFTISTGGAHRVWGPTGTMLEGNNELALALIMVIPLMRYLQLQLSKPLHKQLMLGAIALMAASAIGSQSRGALLAIVAMSGVLILRSRNRVGLSVLMVAVAVAVVSLMPESWHERMDTIKTYEEDGSAMGRLNAWEMNYNIALANLFGGGFSMYTSEVYAIYAPDPRYVVVAHSIYFQILGEHGFIGLFLFLLVWFTTYREFSKVRRFGLATPEHAWMADLAGMCQVSLVGYLVGGAFLSLGFLDLAYNLVLIAVCMSRLMRDHIKAIRHYPLYGFGAPMPGPPAGEGGK